MKHAVAFIQDLLEAADLLAGDEVLSEGHRKWIQWARRQTRLKRCQRRHAWRLIARAELPDDVLISIRNRRYGKDHSQGTDQNSKARRRRPGRRRARGRRDDR